MKMVISLFMFCVFISVISLNFSKNDEGSDYSLIIKQEEKQEISVSSMPEPMNGMVTIGKWGVNLFTTTSFDLQENRDYYEKKFGYFSYQRNEFTVIEPQIPYLPDPLAVEKGYPKIHVQVNNEGDILNSHGKPIEVDRIGRPLNHRDPRQFLRDRSFLN